MGLSVTDVRKWQCAINDVLYFLRQKRDTYECTAAAAIAYQDSIKTVRNTFQEYGLPLGEDPEGDKLTKLCAEIMVLCEDNDTELSDKICDLCDKALRE